MNGITIAGTGKFIPEKVLSNFDLEKIVDTTDEWIRTRTGISERHVADDSTPTSALGAQAALNALDAAGLAPDEVELIITATISPDKPFPNTSCFIQQQIGAVNAACFGVEAACSGFVYILDIGASMIRAGRYTNCLLIGAEKLSSITNWEDRTTCVLFGDGAGAVVLKACASSDDALIETKLGSNGEHADILHIPAGGTREPFSQKVLDDRRHFLHMSGPEVFKLAINCMVDAAQDVLGRSGIGVDQIRWLIPHQANTRILASVGKRLNIPEERTFMNLHKYGNTSAASIPIALDEIVRAGHVESGDYIMMIAFGGGLTWGAALIRWP